MLAGARSNPTSYTASTILKNKFLKELIVVMENFEHTLSALFAQLGLDSAPEDIDKFIHAHRPIPDSVSLPDADCWTESQAAFLRESIGYDSDWAEMVDQLDSRLRE